MRRLVTGITPSGNLTIGNYFGALKPLKKFLENGDEVFCFVADLHALSIPTKERKETIKIHTLEILVALEALGISNSHPNCYVFIQSEHVHHAILGLLLQSFSNIGELERMTQFKNKSQAKQKNKTESISTGLLTYPTLMAADILLYKPSIVPVGKDQKQHLELTKKLAERLNNFINEDFFIIPEFSTPTIGSKIKSLTNPDKKMSKSDLNPKSSIYIYDELSISKEKVKKAKTDSESKILKNYLTEQLGLANLIQIYMASSPNFEPSSSFIERANEENVPYKYLKDKVIQTLLDKELYTFQESVKKIIGEEKTSIDTIPNIIKRTSLWTPSFMRNEFWIKKQKIIDEVGKETLTKLKRKLGLL